MCGIVGFYNSALPSKVQIDRMKGMLSLIKHRGPNEAGYYIDSKMCMGAVLNLSLGLYIQQ